MLHILEVGDATDVAIVDRSIGHPAKTVILIRGDEQGTATLVQTASNAAHQPWREVLWLKAPNLVHDTAAGTLFAQVDDSIPAILLDFDDNVVGQFMIGATLIEIFTAFSDLGTT